MSEWISVKDQLPVNGQTVIVQGGIAYRMHDDWISQTSFASGRVIQWEVTHWQPLPDPPSTSDDTQQILTEVADGTLDQ